MRKPIIVLNIEVSVTPYVPKEDGPMHFKMPSYQILPVLFFERR